MVAVKEILLKVVNLESHDIFELLANRHIGVHFNSSADLFEDGQMCIIIGDNNHVGIFLNPKAEKEYVNYYLWHELGHYETEEDPIYRRNFLLTDSRADYEFEANVFAIFELLPAKCPHGENIYTMARKIGIPINVLKDVIFKLQFDKDPYIRTMFEDYKTV